MHAIVSQQAKKLMKLMKMKEPNSLQKSYLCFSFFWLLPSVFFFLWSVPLSLFSIINFFSVPISPYSRFFCSRPPLLKPPQIFFSTSPNLFLSKTLFLPFFFLSSQTPPFISFIENSSFLSRKMAPASFRCRLLERPPSQFFFLAS